MQNVPTCAHPPRGFRKSAQAMSVLLTFAMLAAPASAQSSLPELGDSSGALVSGQQEKKLGQEAMREIRASGMYLNDPEVNAYLNELGQRILIANPGIRDRFEFFAVGDPAINAFAMPGGFIGVNMGLVLLCQSESELAGVLAHEISHVTQKHYARMVDDQRKNAWMGIAGLAAAVLAAKAGRGDAAQGAIMGSQAALVQNYLNFSRDNEREADRIGFQYLSRAQFDPAAMGTFMERLQRSSSLNDTGVVPGYMRTHPVTGERIADAQDRVGKGEFKLAKESVDFHYVRALIRSYVGDAPAAVKYFEAALAERKYSSEAATRYGLAAAVLRERDFARAKRELATIEASGVKHPMITAMMGQILIQADEIGPAVGFFERAIIEYPNHWQLHYDLPEVLLRAKLPQRALASVEKSLARQPDDVQLLDLAARASADAGLKLKQHRFLGELYARQANLRGALDQFELASKAGDGDYYEASYVEARAREMKREIQLASKARRPLFE
ncbi:MAG: M48 family metallopeptidase [Rhizobacter sp.]|nr:M48 family metallopeptidase [Burkholderiales bacterium]